MTPLKRYYQLIASGQFKPNSLQEQAIILLDNLFHELMETKKSQRRRFSHEILKKIGVRKETQPKGVYLWGSVGVGKTWLMDLFYESLPPTMQFRMHFHRFMEYVHEQMQQVQGKVNPLKLIAQTIAKQSSVVCLDEFLVNDIADAMILAGLLRALFDEGLILVTTANTVPNELYRNGLQRQRFVPAIALLLEHQNVLHITADQDYRLRSQISAQTYFYPESEQTLQMMQKSFNFYAKHQGFEGELLYIHNRPIKTLRCSHEVVWFDFHEICHVPRSQLDYLEIARQFQVVLISNIPHILPQQKNIARYFISLIDVFYDAGLKLILSAHVPAEGIYPEGELAGEFKRTYSRIIEMQGEEYPQKKVIRS